MGAEKNLLTTKRYFNASPVDTFVNLELTGERSFIKPDKTDNVVDLAEKFNEERNACMKFCIYGMVQSKWTDSDAIKIDFRITDSSTNVNATTQPNVFWVYDKTTNVTATTWSVLSRPLDNDGGNLSLNLYRKKKGSYFFPFELDMNLLEKDANGINTNKSIIITITDPSKNAFMETEVPFIFFDEEGTLIEFGQETADILDDGNVVEINNNYPYFYDRHWIRRELIPDGPPYVYFVNQEPLVINEGGNDPRVSNDKLLPIEVSLSEPSNTGMERVNIEVLYGLDETKQPYTTVTVPSDVILQQNFVQWDYVGEDPLKYIYMRVVDDFFVEPTERITLRMTPIYGCLADQKKSQILQIYFNDNDVPSFVSFENANISFPEPRENVFAVPIRINMNLDKTVLVDHQYFDLYVDRQESDSGGLYGFLDTSSPTGLKDSVRINVDKNNLNFHEILRYTPKAEYDFDRKVVLKMSGFTVNLRPQSVSTNTENKLTITCSKHLDDNFCLIEIPYNNVMGNSVVRNVYNVPQADYTNDKGQKLGTNFATKMVYDVLSNMNGQLTPNAKYQISATTATSTPSSQTDPQKNIKTLVVEQEFSLEITNKGTTQVLMDYHMYQPNETLVIDVHSGVTLSTSTNVFTFDGEKFTLRLPANSIFITSGPQLIIPWTGGTQMPITAYSQAIDDGTLTYTATTYGFRTCNYTINIRNNSYNYLGNPIFTRTDAEKTAFYNTNLLKKPIGRRIVSTSGGVTYPTDMSFVAGNDSLKRTYYAGTRLVGAMTRPIEPISASTGTTITLVPDAYYYNGLAILPARGISGNQAVTDSILFISDRKIVEVGGITRPVSGQTALGYNAVLPTSPIIITTPLSAHTYFCPFNFGYLMVQRGYGNVTYYPNGYTSPTVTTDAFSLVNVSGWHDDNVIVPWNLANQNTRNQAVIEIINTGEIESYFPNGIVLKPGERLAISEIPVIPSNGTSGFYNIVRPLSPLTLPLSTNYGYDKTLEKFLKCRYKISFLNFNLYNKNGTFSNKVVNEYISFEDTVVTNGVVKPRYLLSKYGNKVWASLNFTLFQGGLDCSFPVSSRMTQLGTSYKGTYLTGIVMTASIDSPLETAQFVEFDDLPPHIPGLSSWGWVTCNNFLLRK